MIRKKKGKMISEGDSVPTKSDRKEDLILSLQHLSFMDEKDNNVISEDEKLSIPRKVLYYGWFLTNESSVLLKETSQLYLNECLQIEQFDRFLRTSTGLQEIRKDPLEFYKKPGKSKTSDEFTYHITAKFLSREQNTEYQMLAHPFVGKAFRIHIVGWYFTSKTFGIRVNLTDAQKSLFDEREGREHINKSSEGSKDNLTNSKVQNKDEISKYAAENLEKELQSYSSSISKVKIAVCKSKIHSRLSRLSNVKQIFRILPKSWDDFQPSKSRAHITLGCAPKVKAVQTGKDLLDILDLESRIHSPTPVFHQDFTIDGGILRQFGRYGDAYVIYPCHDIVVEPIFNYCL